MYDPIEITRLLAFGTSNPSPDDYNAHIRPAGAAPASITYNMLGYMTDGGGRFAIPSLFGAVEKFFDSSIVIPDKDYTSTEITNLLGFTNDDLTTGISQYGTGIDDGFGIAAGKFWSLRDFLTVTVPLTIVGL